MKKKWLIKGGMVYDGTESEPRKADILLKDGMIDQISEKIPREDAELLDASGCVVTPGFVDIHRHCDGEILVNPEFGKIELAQGITSVVCGNCGMSLAPSRDETRASMYRYFAPCLGELPEDLKAPDMASFFRQAQEHPLRVNVGALVGMGSVRIAVKGFQKSPFTEKEQRKAKELIRDAFRQGALGMSTGLMYLPECYSSFEELRELWKAAAGENGIISCHIRGEGNSLVESVREIVKLSQTSGLKVNISHFKSVGVRNWKREIYRAVKVLEEGNVDSTVDFYPYAGGATTLLSLVPPSLMPENMENFLRELSEEAGKEKLRKALGREHEGWDNMVLDIGWKNIIVNGLKQPEHRGYQGKSLEEIARLGGYKDEADCLAELLVRERGQAGAILMSMDQEDVDYVASLPYSMVISDALYGNKRDPHPRLYGAFPKVIEDFVCRRKVLSLQTAIRKMSSMPAERFGLKGRGKLREGYRGDVNVFVPEDIHTLADYQNPCSVAVGMKAVFVGGGLAFREGQYLGNFGKILRK